MGGLQWLAFLTLLLGVCIGVCAGCSSRWSLSTGSGTALVSLGSRLPVRFALGTTLPRRIVVSTEAIFAGCLSALKNDSTAKTEFFVQIVLFSRSEPVFKNSVFGLFAVESKNRTRRAAE